MKLDEKDIHGDGLRRWPPPDPDWQMRPVWWRILRPYLVLVGMFVAILIVAFALRATRAADFTVDALPLEYKQNGWVARSQVPPEYFNCYPFVAERCGPAEHGDGI